MELAVLTDQPKPVKGFDYCFYEAKHVSGKIREPALGMFNIIACFADNIAAREHPDRVAISDKGKALRADRNYRMLWDWICPTNEEQRQRLLDLIGDISKKKVLGIRLDCAQFPKDGFCKCNRCMNFRKGRSWEDFRASTITEFVKDAWEISKVPLMIGLEPDPSFLRERFGQDIVQLSEYIDSFCVPIYMDYSITYWCDIITYSFRRKVKKKLIIDLYAGYPRKPLEELFKAMLAVANYADAILLSTFDYLLGEYTVNLLLDGRFYDMAEQRNCKPMLELLDSLRSRIGS